MFFAPCRGFLFVPFPLGVPNGRQRSASGGESGGIGRFNERGAVSLCDPIAEREPYERPTGQIRDDSSSFCAFFSIPMQK